MHTAIGIDMISMPAQDRVATELDDIDSLVRNHRARLLRFVAFSVGDPDIAASIVQDCFLKAYSSRENFRNDCAISTWLTTIAMNLVRDHLRVQKYRFWRKVGRTSADIMEVASFLPGNERTPEQQLLAREQAAAVATAVDSLSLRQRAVFLLRFSEEMELAEISKALDMPVNTVKTHLHRAVKAVRERVGANTR